MIRLYWPAERWSDNVLAHLRRQIRSMGCPSEPVIDVLHVPDQDWDARWAASVRPVRIGRRVLIRPSWEHADLESDDIELIIDPKQAFGTGHHATTQLLIEWLEELIKGGESVLDVGTGSGILAMTALRLGAASAVGIDADPVAIDCAREYAAVNGCGRELTLQAASLEQWAGTEDIRFDLIVANLDRNTLFASGVQLMRCVQPGAKLLLSGILVDDQEDIASILRRHGGLVTQTRQREEWLALAVLFPDSCEG